LRLQTLLPMAAPLLCLPAQPRRVTPANCRGLLGRPVEADRAVVEMTVMAGKLGPQFSEHGGDRPDEAGQVAHEQLFDRNLPCYPVLSSPQ